MGEGAFHQQQVLTPASSADITGSVRENLLPRAIRKTNLLPKLGCLSGTVYCVYIHAFLIFRFF